jgi:hypothetical protein
VLEKHGKM